MSTPTRAKPGENGSTGRAQFYSSHEAEVQCNTATRCRLQSLCSAKGYLWEHIQRWRQITTSLFKRLWKNTFKICFQFITRDITDLKKKKVRKGYTLLPKMPEGGSSKCLQSHFLKTDSEIYDFSYIFMYFSYNHKLVVSIASFSRSWFHSNYPISQRVVF